MVNQTVNQMVNHLVNRLVKSVQRALSHRDTNRIARDRTHGCHHNYGIRENGGHLKDRLLLGGAIHYVMLFCLPHHSYHAR